MKYPLPVTPFPATGYYGPKYFCDREEETEKLLSALKGGINVTLFALRRIGKTGLIFHTFHHLKKEKNYVTIYLDILHTTDLKGFLEVFAAAVHNAFPENSSASEKIRKFIAALRPLITFDSLTGLPQMTFQFATDKEKESTLQSIFRYLEQQPFKIAIAIDEFQQIAYYPEKNVEALLRSEIQQMRNTHFIFSGSQQQLLMNMFGSAKRPFFASTQMMKLNKLDIKRYTTFIYNHFKKSGKQIDKEDIEFILDRTRCHTFYSQFVYNRLYLTSGDVIDKEKIESEFNKILLEQENLYINYRDILPNAQWKLLIAIAKEERLYNPTAGAFIKNYNLGTASTVKRALEALLAKEMVYKDNDESKNSFYQVYDVFFSRWLEQNY